MDLKRKNVFKEGGVFNFVQTTDMSTKIRTENC